MKKKVINLSMQDNFYLVVFSGIPDWKGEFISTLCTRRYLFSSLEKATSFVARRTATPDWITGYLLPNGSMISRLKKGSSNRYQIVSLTVDDVYDEDIQ